MKPSSTDGAPSASKTFNCLLPSLFYKILIISLVTLVLIAGFTNLPIDQIKYDIFKSNGDTTNTAESLSPSLPAPSTSSSLSPSSSSLSSSSSSLPPKNADFESKISKPTGNAADTEELPLSRPPLSCPPSSSFSSLSSKRAGKVLLMTYGRSGSTFTSSLISHHDNVFYTFEPLFIHKTNQLTPTPNNSVPILDEYLTCNFTREFIYAVESRHNSDFPDTKEIYQCLKQLKGIALLKCYATFQENCQQKQMKVVKTIRSRVEWAEWFLETYPDFYLLYLVRDPRATIASQIKNFLGLNISVSTVICSQMKKDLAAAERLKSLYPDRVMGIRYENGAMDPFQYTRDIYKFLGLNYDNNTECHVKDLTMHDPTDYKRNTHAYAVFRENSTETMDKWRKTIPFEWVIVVDTLCGPLYSKLGYRTVESLEDLRSGKSLLTKPGSDSVFEK